MELAAPGSVVRDVAVSALEVGTTCRVRVVVDHDAGAGVSRQWFVKLPSSSRRARLVVGLVRLPQQEVRFYQTLARELAPSCPEALVAQARLGRGFTVVLPDVT